MSNSRFNIIGAGAVGHLWTCYLQKAGFLVNLYSRQPMNKRTVQVNTSTNTFKCEVEYHSFAEWQDADITLICVKAFQLDALCQMMVNHVKKKPPIILIMNGMGLEEIVAQHLPDTPVFQAAFSQGALLDDSTILHTGRATTFVGDASGRNDGKIIETAIGHLNHALPVVEWNSQHWQCLFLKLVINAVINPITAIRGIRNGDLVSEGKLDAEAESLLEEIGPLIDELVPDLSLAQIKKQIIDVAQNTANNHSSMLQDVKRNHKTEIDFINGYLVNLAKKRAIHLFLHSQMISKINQLTRD